MTSAKGSLPLGVGVDPQTRRVMEQLIEKTDVNEGLRGDPLDRGLKVRDLIDLGLAKSLSRNAQRLVSGGNLQPTIAAPDLAVPPAPTGFSVTGGFSHIFLSWDNPQELYRNHSYTVIYRNTVDNVANAVAIAQVATGSLYADLDVSYGSTYYYWIRFVSEADITGPYNSSVGLFAKLSEDPAQLLARLEGEIRETHLFADLNARINLIDSDGTGLVTLVQVQSQVIDSLNASYSVKIDNNGYVTGFGLSSEANNGEPESLFLVSADRFAISNPNANKKLLSGLTRSGATATATCASHGMAIGDKIVITRAQDTRWNGMWTVASVPNSSTFTFAVSGSETTPAIGVIRANGYPLSSLTRSSTTATASRTAHGFVVGQEIAIIGADQDQYNGKKTITAVTANTFSFVVSGSPATPATASIVAARGAIPFVVDNGKVVMDGVWIKDLSVNTQHVGEITVDKISGIDASYINVRILNGSITNAKIGSFIRSDNYVAAFSGWTIDKSGYAEFQNIYARGNIQATSLQAGTAMVDTLNVAGEAITAVRYGEGSSGTLVSGNQVTAVALPSMTLPATISGVLLTANVSAVATGSRCNVFVEFLRGGSVIKSCNGGALEDQPTANTFNYFDASPGTSPSYSLRLRAGPNGLGNGAGNFDYYSPSLIAHGAKR
jgi:hypothetical protein